MAARIIVCAACISGDLVDNEAHFVDVTCRVKRLPVCANMSVLVRANAGVSE